MRKYRKVISVSRTSKFDAPTNEYTIDVQARDPALTGGDTRLTETRKKKENSVADEPQAAPAGEANGSFRLAGKPPAAPREHLLSRAPSARRPL